MLAPVFVRPQPLTLFLAGGLPGPMERHTKRLFLKVTGRYVLLGQAQRGGTVSRCCRSLERLDTQGTGRDNNHFSAFPKPQGVRSSGPRRRQGPKLFT